MNPQTLLRSLFCARAAGKRFLHRPSRSAALTACLLLTTALGGLGASATPIVYTLSGNFTGTLGSTTLSGPVVFSMSSDTNAVADMGGYFTNTTGTTTISYGGQQATLSSATFGVEAELCSAAFEDTSSTGNFYANAFNCDIPLNILSQTGVSYTGDYVSLLMGSTPTSNGALTITGVTGSTTFSTSAVSVTPEPSSLALLGTGMLTVVGVLRRRLIQS